MVRINVSATNSSICLRLLLATRERVAGFSACCVGTSALMAHIRAGTLPRHTGSEVARRDRKYLKKNDNFPA
jgi:hypothetical protein